MGLFGKFFCRRNEPTVALSNNIYLSKEIAGFSITKLGIDNKTTQFNALITDSDAKLMAQFIKSKL